MEYPLTSTLIQKLSSSSFFLFFVVFGSPLRKRCTRKIYIIYFHSLSVLDRFISATASATHVTNVTSSVQFVLCVVSVIYFLCVNCVLLFSGHFRKLTVRLDLHKDMFTQLSLIHPCSPPALSAQVQRLPPHVVQCQWWLFPFLNVNSQQESVCKGF